MVYVGTNYHPHDWPRKRWPEDIRLMQEAGIKIVRLGHLCWDSFEPSEGNFTFEWFDEVMDLFAEAGIKVVLDIAARPAPIWLHKKYPGINITNRHGQRLEPVHRYMVDVGHPAFQEYAYRFAERLVARYAHHPALYAFGLCNEVGSGMPSYSEEARQRFIRWLRARYSTVDELNRAWAAHRWSRKLNSFEDVEFPVAGEMSGAPERMLDLRRFQSEEQIGYLRGLRDIVRRLAPHARETTNHWAEYPELGFDYLQVYRELFDLPGIGFYPGVNPEDRNALFGTCLSMLHRIGEKEEQPIWCLEFQTGSFGAYGPPKGAMRMYAYLALLHRAEAIFAWTWRSMLGGEEQYLFGLLDHDGSPGRKYEEFAQFAREMDKLREIGLPYLPQPEIALAYSFESYRVAEGQRFYYRTSYIDQVMQTFLALNEDNMDCNVVDLRHMEKPYKLLLIPGHCVMDEASAETVRRFVAEGGVAVMTAYSAKVDEHNQVFSTPMPGRLADVFGIRANAFERPVAHYSEANEGGLQKQKLNLRREAPKIKFHGQVMDLEIDYYERLELDTAEILATITNLEEELPAVTVNAYGKGKAFYVAVPAQMELMRVLLNDFYGELGIKKGPATPHGVSARRIGDHVLYVNTTSEEKHIELEAPGWGLLTGQHYQDRIVLGSYEVEVIAGK